MFRFKSPAEEFTKMEMLPYLALGFGVKHFCSVAFEGAPKEFYQVTIEPGRGSDAEKARYYFSSLPPWQK